MNPKLDFFFTQAKTWSEEYTNLRMIVLDCGLTEELKWGVPCYTYEKKNVVLIHGFKEYCALLFMKGALMKDKIFSRHDRLGSLRSKRFLNLNPRLKPILKKQLPWKRQAQKWNLKRLPTIPFPKSFK